MSRETYSSNDQAPSLGAQFTSTCRERALTAALLLYFFWTTAQASFNLGLPLGSQEEGRNQPVRPPARLARARIPSSWSLPPTTQRPSSSSSFLAIISMPLVALVTGSSSGIGRATAVALSKAGFAVVLSGRRQAELEATVQLAGGEAVQDRLLVVAGDINDEEGVKALFEKAVAKFSGSRSSTPAPSSSSNAERRCFCYRSCRHRVQRGSGSAGGREL